MRAITQDEISVGSWYVVIGLVPDLRTCEEPTEYLREEQQQYSLKSVEFTGEPLLVVGIDKPFVLCRSVHNPNALDTIDLRTYALAKPSWKYVQAMYMDNYAAWCKFRKRFKETIVRFEEENGSGNLDYCYAHELYGDLVAYRGKLSREPYADEA
jgi:hypothetical protein